ncbi:MAG: hypothetical protein A2075_13230 [Geobacteraceae bacterium GWC2_58_44]|nr:MAG: hypothetical protein A2075_13230 [Geobacteraceae bacterium GWC2_58_44]
MSQYYKLPLADDYGGVHTNNTIISHAYYLLAAGMNGAIGIGDAERIFYRALTTHLTTQSEFIDARLACIRSAKELFGDDSAQAARTAAAFDAVEVTDSTPAPTPTPGPAAGGSDATLSVSVDPDNQVYRLARRETALGDGNAGSWLSQSAAAYSRPSVTADGTAAVFVKADNDLCLISTDDSSSETCIGVPGLVYSAAISPDGDYFGFVLLGEDGNPENKITVYNQATDQTHTYALVAPASEGVTLDSVASADVMVFTANSRFLIYDALNVLKMADGSKITAWSIYAIDLVTGETLIVVPPMANLDIGFPALGHTSDDLIAFEARSQATGQSTVFAGNIRTGTVAAVAVVANDYGVASFTGDDSAIVYSVPDAAQWTGHSIYRQPLASDHMTPAGTASLWLQDADFGVIYRRGAYHKLTVSNNDRNSGSVNSSVGGISCGDSCSFIYPEGTQVTLTARSYTAATFTGWGGACSGTENCTVTLNQARAVTATFSGTFSLSGSVRSGNASGPAVTGATVSIAGKTATTDSAGTFSISGISAGSYPLTISATGYSTYSNASHAVAANQSGLNFALVPASGYSMAGTVHSGTVGGPAISGATVSIAGKTGTTDASGAFSISGLTAGSYALTISAAGYSTHTNPSYAISASQSGLNFTLTSTSATAKVKVSGSPLPYALLQPAYIDAADGAAILSQGVTFSENLLLGASKAVVIKGGYDATFTSRPGYTTLDGILKIRRGRVVADRFKIR